MDINKYKIPTDKLKKVCSVDTELIFCTTSSDVAPFNGVIGQDRATKSMEFGLAMDASGYNIFISGYQGTGRSTYAESVVSQAAKGRNVPLDWCYVNNFNEYDNPIAISLPAGKGRVFQKDTEELINELKTAIPKAFEANEYDQKKDLIVISVRQKMGDIIQKIEHLAAESNFSVQQESRRIMFLPLRDGKPLDTEEYEKLSSEEKKEIEEKGHKLEKILEESIKETQILEKKAAEEIEELKKNIVITTAGPLFDKLTLKYKDYEKIVDFYDIILNDVIENHNIFVKTDSSSANQGISSSNNNKKIDSFVRYQVNLFVNNEKTEGAPVIIEHNPSYYNLFGKIEYKSQISEVATDFTMIKPGAIHKANGGYLILQAKDLLYDGLVWDSLKKCLKYENINIENIGEQYRLVPTKTLKPEGIPLNVKIILIGTPQYYQIFNYDEDFQKFFKVKVDFDIEMPRNQENICKYASFVSYLCKQNNFKHFKRDALAKVIEYGSRLTSNQNKLSTRFNEVTEIVYEAATLANKDKSSYVESKHVNNAIQDRKYRVNMIEEKIQEQILEGKIIIDTKGSVTGQINGLYVVGMGGHSFGMPARITARTYMGRGGIINIERETEMSGNIHSKGVMILAGYMGGKFAQENPLSLTAQLTFEQNYQGVDGDSASSAELYAILSSLSEVPIKQNFAVTGSVNQNGIVQPIGGVNEKIEGFYDICKAIGLTGEQGVVIPYLNVNNLMLKDEIIEAVNNNLFHIYAVKYIEEGIEILTGMKAGQIDEKGDYPKDSLFYLVDKKLKDYYNQNKEVKEAAL